MTSEQLHATILHTTSLLLVDLVFVCSTNHHLIESSQLDIILGMDWLSSNHVLLICFNKIISFIECKPIDLLYVGQVQSSLKNDDKVHTMLAYLKLENNIKLEDIPVVREFPEVFLKVFPSDFSSLPPKKEIEFSIDLVPDVMRNSLKHKSRKLQLPITYTTESDLVGRVQLQSEPALSSQTATLHHISLHPYVQLHHLGDKKPFDKLRSLKNEG
ncbi:hypothetical protein Fmac_028258 [Flemingia macrophylla]|uniref:Reverse transcriptase n=1 Tax=Flemingia macrophylla TaxID=520843 RepID=A0ABD1L700_9FABA